MAFQPLKPQPFRPPKEAIASWDNWKKGLNTLLRENEIGKDELVTAQNLMLVGKGVPTKRWGSQDYFLAGATGYGRFVLPVVDPDDDSINVLGLTDWGYLVKKNGASYTLITGTSWPSGSKLNGVQLGGNVYLTSSTRELVRYDFNTLTSFPTISAPAGLTATNLSGASGLTTWSWRITATGRGGGETNASSNVQISTLPTDLTKTSVRLTWTATSAASGDVLGYNIYRGAPGDEVWVGGVDNATTSFDDLGFPTSDPFRVVPLANTTGGPKAAYALRYQDRLVLAGVPGYPTRVMISGRFPQQERFDWYAGGGYIEIEPDSGEKITGLATYYNSSSQSQTIIVFKERSVWELKIGFLTIGNYVILDPQYRLLTASQGCSSHRSIAAVENDIMFANRKGIYILRYEPQLINVINANELSAKIRPFFESLSDSDHLMSAAAYFDKKYILSFPESKQHIIFDRERLSFMGPWTTPFGVNHWAKYLDVSGTERLVAMDSDDGFVSEFAKSLSNDKGSTIRTIMRTKKEDFGDWTIFKTLNEIYLNFRSVVGEVDVNIYIEDRSGSTVSAKAFTVSGSTSAGTSGFGVDLFGMFQFGTTGSTPTTTTSDELPQKAVLYKSARYFQVEVRTEGLTDNYELLGLKAISIPQPRGNSPSSWKVS